MCMCTCVCRINELASSGTYGLGASGGVHAAGCSIGQGVGPGASAALHQDKNESLQKCSGGSISGAKGSMNIKYVSKHPATEYPRQPNSAM